MFLADIEAAEDALSQAEDQWDLWDAVRRREFLSTLARLLGHDDFLRATFAHVRVMRAQLDELPFEAVADTSESEDQWAESLAILLQDPGERDKTHEAVNALEAALSLRPTSPGAREHQRDRILEVLSGSRLPLH